MVDNESAGTSIKVFTVIYL